MESVVEKEEELEEQEEVVEVDHKNNAEERECTHSFAFGLTFEHGRSEEDKGRRAVCET